MRVVNRGVGVVLVFSFPLLFQLWLAFDPQGAASVS